MSSNSGSFNSCNSNVSTLCYCRIKAKMSTAHTMGNYGRRFLGCANYRSDTGCKFFSWIDQPFEPQAWHVIQKLMKQKKECEEKIRVLEGSLKAKEVLLEKKSNGDRITMFLGSLVVVVVVFSMCNFI